MNSPETPLFHKGDNLYTISDRAAGDARCSALIVVEGYVDVIAMVTRALPARSPRSAPR